MSDQEKIAELERRVRNLEQFVAGIMSSLAAGHPDLPRLLGKLGVGLEGVTLTSR